MEVHRGGKALISDLSGLVGVNLLVHAGRWKVLTEALAVPSPSFWVGGTSSSIEGFAWGRVAQLAEFGPLLGMVDFLYVQPVSRNSGVGESLMHKLEKWFIQQGCSAMDANALPGDRLSKGFFEEAGFKARLLVMSRNIGGGPTK